MGAHEAGYGAPRGFSIRASDPKAERVLQHGDLYSAALAFLDGRIRIEGDLFAALRELSGRGRGGFRQWLYTALARTWRLRPEAWYLSRSRARRNIRFHYDHPLDFYRQFLDSRLVYSCAYFEQPGMSLDQAQAAKLDLICRKLDVKPGERFYDVGCGFGALVAHAAEHYGARAGGCTLSRRQFEAAGTLFRERGLNRRARVELADYRDLHGRFDKMSSIGMVEHVGLRRLDGYFARIHSVLAPDGVFLNHGIARPETVEPGPGWVFLQRRVFPGGDLPRLSQIVLKAEKAGFEVLDVENLRPHYARTCRLWVERLLSHEELCTELVGAATFRTWVLYLAVSSLNFEAGLTDVFQVLLMKRGAAPRHWTRRYIYP